MKSGLLAALLAFPVLSQTLTGIVQKIDKEQFEVRSRDQVLTLHADEKTSIRKLNTANLLANLATGDEVRVTYYGEGTLTAVDVSVKVTVSGVITEVRGSRILVEIADRKAPLFVSLNPGIKLGVSRAQLLVGRKIHVTGWDAGEGIIEAAGVSLADGDADRDRIRH